MRTTMTRKQWDSFNGWVAHLINHPSFGKCCSREIAECALVGVFDPASSEVEVSDELLEGAIYVVSHRRKVRRRRLHRERGLAAVPRKCGVAWVASMSCLLSPLFKGVFV